MTLRAELEVTAPVAGPSSEWSAASELAEVEKLAEMGVVLKPQQPMTKKARGKARADLLPMGHLVFVDEREECESYCRGYS